MAPRKKAPPAAKPKPKKKKGFIRKAAEATALAAIPIGAVLLQHHIRKKLKAADPTRGSQFGPVQRGRVRGRNRFNPLGSGGRGASRPLRGGNMAVPTQPAMQSDVIMTDAVPPPLQFRRSIKRGAKFTGQRKKKIRRVAGMTQATGKSAARITPKRKKRMQMMDISK